MTKTLFTLGLAAVSFIAAPALADDTNNTAPKKGTSTTKKGQSPSPQGQSPSPQGQSPSPSPQGQSEKGVHNRDDDTDLAVGDTPVSQTQTTAAVRPGERPDVIESRPEERRKVDGDMITVAPMFGYGSRDLNVGIGARAGYTLRDTPIYVGGNFIYHFGDTVSVPTGGEASARFYYPSAELGYDLGVGPLLLRPYAGAGVMLGSGSTSGGAPASAIPRNTDTAGLFYPGVTAHYLIPQTPGFVGADARVLIPTQNSAAFSAFLTGGLNL